MKPKQTQYEYINKKVEELTSPLALCAVCGAYVRNNQLDIDRHIAFHNVKQHEDQTKYRQPSFLEKLKDKVIPLFVAFISVIFVLMLILTIRNILRWF